ncbi:hypothetical protein TH66_06105 [Carbonactinospora thermoautotrophica]|uniref:Helicase C-terminal domain-containing protein n=1 Tax=Carbonactinospora thermoautotrophica TaxID=1469144 RepID=A0A132N447_9ACTN|nr:hypothetical protein TH66_06105 [Carbonactinospora thermoautotrophica]
MGAGPQPVEVRRRLEELVVRDLLGPIGGETEQMPSRERPTEYYILGRLAPRGTLIDPGGQDTLAEGEPAEEGDIEPEAPGSPSLHPSALGLTCCVLPEARRLRVRAAWGQYLSQKIEVDGEPRRVWQRVPRGGERVIDLAEGRVEPQPVDPEQPDVVVTGRIRRLDGLWYVTLFLVNTQRARDSREDAWVFQAELTVTGEEPGTPVFGHRPAGVSGGDEQDRAEQRRLAMAYRFHPEFAVGHGVGVHAEPADGDPLRAVEIRTTAVPAYEVPHTEAPTPEQDPDLRGLSGLVTDMARLGELADRDPAGLEAALAPLVGAYREWIEARAAEIDDPTRHLAGYRREAEQALADAREAADRIEAGIALLRRDPLARKAFAFANRAMHLQRVHTLAAGRRKDSPELPLAVALQGEDQPKNRSWRPFQLAFILLNLPSLADPRHAERAGEGLADLLWFPTGGGKTEAYLGLTAFTLAVRRLQPPLGGLDPRAGVAVLMRYTLRLLTIQQYQRAATLICACETLRATDPATWGEEPFRIGLWVGAGVTPNNTDNAAEWCKEQRRSGGHRRVLGSPYQLTHCPWCGQRIEPGQDITVDAVARRTVIACGNVADGCPFTLAARPGEGLPVLMVDEEIYRLLPGLLIATVDKFAQLPWNGATQALFGVVDKRCERHGYLTPDLAGADWESPSHPARDGHPKARTVAVSRLRPPDLIIQDELHLIAGPLGSLVGLYECAVDRLCSWELDNAWVSPKVIASTATVRRAERQIGALFLRRTRVFPPPGLETRDSFFARQRGTRPGRRYLGICAHGLRMKNTLIRVYVAVLGAAQKLYEEYGNHPAVDPYLTLVGYFNSLRDLGGMRRVVEDDVATRLGRAAERGLANRRITFPRELTSRMSSDEIPEVLDLLGVPFGGKGGRKPIDVLLATNMIAVGVDVPRLGLMVVTNQPKSTAEYIQATSRVGRTHPGLVFTVLNWARPRDLSHYERFEHFHATFYRHVEGLSVTPFAGRARDRGLTGVLVGLVRNLDPAWNDNLAAQRFDRHSPIADHVVMHLKRRASLITGESRVARDVEDELATRLDEWHKERLQPGRRLAYKRTPRGGDVAGLLREPGLGGWSNLTCPTSLRDVEPGIRLLLNPDYDLGSAAAPPYQNRDQQDEEAAP